MAASAVPAGARAATRLLAPLLDRVLVKKAESITKTKGGIILPEKAQAKVLQGKVLAVGPGARNKKGAHIPLSVKVGDLVLLPEYGGTKVELDDTEFIIYREGDILAKLEQ